MTLARAEGLTVREEPYSIDQWRSDAKSGRLTEAFACGTSAFIAPVIEIDKRRIGAGTMGPITTTLRKKHRQVLHGEDSVYKHLLTPLS